MNHIKLYITFYFGKRKPEIDFFLNNEKFEPRITWQEKIGEYQINLIYEHYSVLKKDNILSITQRDKTDEDMTKIDNKWIDHYVQIKEIEIDDIKFETALFGASKFEHSMSKEWIDRVTKEGHKIFPVYENCTELRLNGTYTCSFSIPIWRWIVNSYNSNDKR